MSSDLLQLILRARKRPTLRDRKKSDDADRIPVGSAYIVMNVTDRQVERIILILPCRHRYGRFVTAEDYRNEREALGISDRPRQNIL